MRATSPRRYNLSVSMAHEPWETLGFWTSGMIGSEWTSFERVFAARVSEDSARIQVDLGGDTADVFLSDVEMGAVGVSPADSARLEYSVVYEWNSRGCRAGEYPIPPEPGTFRILALGDSYTAGVGVYGADLFTAVMEERLNARAGATGDGRRFEVINCGVSGFGTREQRLYYQQRAGAYQPDLVLVVMTANDDRSFGQDVELGYVHRRTKWEYLFDAAYAVQVLRHQRPEPDFTDAMLELAALDREVAEDGAELAVALFTNTSSPAWDLLTEHATSATAELDIPLLDLRDALSTVPAADLMVHPTDGHPNEIAHRLAAEAILEWLERGGMLIGGTEPDGTEPDGVEPDSVEPS